MNAPIEIPDNPTPAQLWVAARYMIASIGGFAVGRGWLGDDFVALLTLLTTTGVPLAIGVWKIWAMNNKTKSIILDPRTNVPAEVATVS